MEKDQNENNLNNISENKTNENSDNEQNMDNPSKKDIEEHKPEEKTLEEKYLELEDKLARTFAEMENQRRRFEKERDDAFEYGGFSFAKETLNLIDNLERSKITIEKDENLKNSEGFDKIINHLDIIHKDMLSILKKNNIYPIDSIGKKLDPNLHQAMMEIEDETKENGTIVQEIQKGFMMKDRLLRPSLVGVAKKIDQKEQNSGENKEKNDEKK